MLFAIIDKRKIDLYVFSRAMYSVEHSIGAFCMHLFNNQKDIYEFYDPIVRLCLATNTYQVVKDGQGNLFLIIHLWFV